MADVSDWRPMSENAFPWAHKDVILVAFDENDPDAIEIFRARCAEHGAYFQKNGGMLSLHEEGWIPFAWRPDDAPPRDNEKFPPLLTDYLTDA